MLSVLILCRWKNTLRFIAILHSKYIFLIMILIPLFHILRLVCIARCYAIAIFLRVPYCGLYVLQVLRYSYMAAYTILRLVCIAGVTLYGCVERLAGRASVASLPSRAPYKASVHPNMAPTTSHLSLRVARFRCSQNNDILFHIIYISMQVQGRKKSEGNMSLK